MTVDESADTERLVTLQSLCRVTITGLLLGPGVSKFLTYERSVAFFRTLRLPAPGLLVPIVGGIELGIAAALLLDRAPRASALAALPVMVTAAATAGVTWQNVGVVLAALALLGVETRASARPRSGIGAVIR